MANQSAIRYRDSKILLSLAIACSSSLFGQATESKSLLPDAPQISLVFLRSKARCR